MRRQHINGYSCDEHGERIIHYVCDPKKIQRARKQGALTVARLAIGAVIAIQL